MRSGLLLAVVLGGTSGVFADTISVPGDFPTIQAAIDAAQDGDEVVVAPGTYVENLHVDEKSITVRSSDGPDVTIIRPTGEANPLVRLENLLPGALFKGFTLTTKETPVQNDLIRIQGGEVTVSDCILSNSPFHGIKIETASNATIIDCTFQGLSTQGEGKGAAIYVQTGMNTTISGCTFLNNTAIRGGSIYIDENGSVGSQIIDCTFIGNYASAKGGAIFISHANQSIDNSTTLIGCVFIGNSADFGGAIYNGEFADPIFINCLIRGNEALIGGGMFNTIGLKFPRLVNCTIVQNVAAVGGGVANDDFTLLAISNSIISFNQPDQIADDPLAATTVLYSNVQGGWPGTGNIDADPLFVDPDGGDYRLSSGSPAIDAGNNWGVPIDENDYDEDGVLCELFPVDLDGNPRFNADEADFDPGCGVPVVVDMGAYEYQFDPADQVTFADLNGDGSVGVKDLLGLLGSWGPCKKGCCLADLDLEGSVGVPDLLILLGSWGPCP